MGNADTDAGAAAALGRPPRSVDFDDETGVRLPRGDGGSMSIYIIIAGPPRERERYSCAHYILYRALIYMIYYYIHYTNTDILPYYRTKYTKLYKS